MQEPKTLYVLDEEPVPCFAENVPCSYYKARCEYAQLSRVMHSLYHAECYAKSLTGRYFDPALLGQDEMQSRYLTLWKEEPEKLRYTEEEMLDHILYRRGFSTQLMRFYTLESALHWIKGRPIPPWCQYCMQMFD